jgi:hypothetical protein
MNVNFYIGDEFIENCEITFIPDIVVFNQKEYKIVSKVLDMDKSRFEIHLEEKC